MTKLNAEWTHHYAVINGIHTHFVEQGEGIPVVLCHGFPHLWFSWHRQIPVLARAGFRIIAPDMRGMGQTEAPEEPQKYDVEHITGDLLGLLDHLGEEKAIFIGLDFGAFANYDFALRHPERTMAVIGLQNPVTPHNPEESPLTEYRRMGEAHFLHIAYFLEQPRADDDLNNNVREFLQKVYWTLSGEVDYFDMFKHPVGTSYIDAMVEPPALPWPWLSELELEVFVNEYAQCGFSGGLNWYRSMDMKWEQRRPYEGIKSEVPAWFIGSEADVDLRGFHGDDPLGLMRATFPNLMDVQWVKKAGHMIQLEASEQLNVILVDYVSRIRESLG